MEHLFHLAHPYADRAIGILLDAGVNGHIGRRTVVLRPVELDSATDPWPCQTYKGGLDDMVKVHEMALGNLVIGHLHTTAQFWQYHHLDILILNPDGQIVLVNLLVAHRLNDGVWIYHSTRTLINSLFQEHRVFLWFTDLISRNRNQFSPCFY